VTERLNIDAQFFRKERAVGMVPREGCHPTTEDLDEVVLCLHEELADSPVPFCAFNSRVDVWLDIGSKAHGIRAMQAHYGLTAAQVSPPAARCDHPTRIRSPPP
jgi:IMP and pyridine-specific 5'-nucleotidase